jgi:S1-C subfamily serine protease
MNVQGQLSQDGTVQVHCPRHGCTATLRVKPKGGRTWVTCAAAGCGHRFVLDVTDFKEPAEAKESTPTPPPLPAAGPPPLPPKERFRLENDDRPEPSMPVPPPGRPRRRRPQEPAGSGSTALLVGGGIAAFLVVAGGVAATLVYVLKDRGDTPSQVAQNQTTSNTTTAPILPALDSVKPKDDPTKVKPAVALNGAADAADAEDEPADPPTTPGTPTQAAPPPKKGPKKGNTSVGPGKPVPRDAKEAIEKVKKSTALIERKDGWGTGFVIKPGIVMTNFHVISGAMVTDLSRDDKNELKVSFVSLDDTAPPPLKPTLLYCDPRRDLAILRVDTDRPPLEMCPSGTDLQGLEVAVVGNPRGDGGQAQINKVTTGSLANPVRRNAEWTYYELRAEAFFGNSGGPVVDLKTGKLVGVMQSILGDGKNKSYCIPYGEAMRALERLPESKEKEPEAARIAAGRHYLDYFNKEMPILENMARNAMTMQLNILKAKAHGPGARAEVLDKRTGQWLSATEVMTQLKEEYAKIYPRLEKALDGPVKASPEVPSAVASKAKHRLEACGAMRSLASGKTDTETSFRHEMETRTANDDKAARAFEEDYKKFLENMDRAKGK